MSNLQASRWAPRPSRSTYTTHHLTTTNITNLTPTTPSTSSVNTNTNPNTNINPNTRRPRSLSPTKSKSIPTGTTTNTTSSSTSKLNLDLQSRQRSLKNYHLLLRRLKWKATNLLFSFRRVFVHIANETASSPLRPPGAAASERVNELDYAMPSLEAETMFKIDFFEFYVLLERVLVQLLGVWGVVVSGGYAVDARGVDGDGNRSHDGDGGHKREGGSILGTSTSRSFGNFPHRFHANVLSALDADVTPLHDVLGKGRVRDYLGIAKEFRNRWKDAEERGKDVNDDGLVGSRYERLLLDLKVEEMLGEILGKVEGCRGLAEGEVRRVEGLVEGGGNTNGNGVGLGEEVVEMEMDYDASPWEAVDDAMEMD